MTPEDLAALHARAMEHAVAWSARSFAEILASPASVLVTQDPSSWRRNSSGRAAGRGANRPPLSATRQTAQSLGFALGRVMADQAELLALVVDPEHRGQGLGHALLTRFEAESAGRGAATGFLEVAADNQPALKLYKTAGWTKTGARAAYYPRGTKPAANALILRKVLIATSP
ncbi:MAG: GNAT family N-acetyltransferase [Pseudomonadota bacterium]